LQRDGVKAGDGLELVFEFVEQRSVTGRLFARRERVHLGELRPGDRQHGRGRIELHGAAAERDHRLIERQITVLQALEIAQQGVFAVM
jgi:hypothetical protein